MPMVKDRGIIYTSPMPKCEAGCTCKRHSKVGSACVDGCTCARHGDKSERGRKISLAKRGRALTPEHRAALQCVDGCTCAKHGLRNAGQFKAGQATRQGIPHTDETRAKLAQYAGPDASSYKHGWSGTPTYNTWTSVHSRCRDVSNGSWQQYGARGIKVCARWSDFLLFLADMGPRPADKTIDRINGDGNYEPSNCRWATKEEQTANRRDPWIARRKGTLP